MNLNLFSGTKFKKSTIKKMHGSQCTKVNFKAKKNKQSSNILKNQSYGNY